MIGKPYAFWKAKPTPFERQNPGLLKDNTSFSREKKMQKRLLVSCILTILKLVGLSLVFSSSVSAATPHYPFPQHVKYPDSIQPNQFTQAEQDEHVQTFYDYWKQNYLVSAGNDNNGKQMYRVAFAQDSDTTVSEGQGYGMIIVSLMAGYETEAQNLFDGLWRFVRQYPSTIDSRLMAWKVQNGSAVEGVNSAFDGDADIAYGLLLAAAQWGNQGEINYQTEAGTIIAGILASTIGPESRLPMLGDWTQPNGDTYNQYTPRSSDFMLANFQAFAQATGDNSTWQTVINNSHTVIGEIQQQYSPGTGLLPDFIQCQSVTQCAPAQAHFLEGANDGNYYYNAGRVPWRLGLHALLHNDATSRSQVQKITDWLVTATGGDASAIKSGYQLNGTYIGNYFSTFFAAPFGVGAMLSNQQDFLNAIYAQVYQRQENYYEDSVNLLSLLVMTGNAWAPVVAQESRNGFLPALLMLLL
ncbi:MAG: glycosyl hydrolase family 8 [Candidatus Electrothrix aestuarii]|uniref:cellulase n=1 Tax=Candidatus Electrothrix aestuarii TaxID=3062594 RepID=A0AAU8LQ58_9BACT|nr:glycosyl hydrolase family 8 [Candidatus Electrothrix aestuarii]